MRPSEQFIFLTESEWTSLDPVVPINVFAVSTDTRIGRFGDGINKWSDLKAIITSGIGDKAIQTNRAPNDCEGLIFCASENKWIFRSIGCFISDTEINTITETIYPKFSLIIETSGTGNTETGRFKIGDGKTAFSNLPWVGGSIDEDDMILNAIIFGG